MRGGDLLLELSPGWGEDDVPDELSRHVITVEFDGGVHTALQGHKVATSMADGTWRPATAGGSYGSSAVAICRTEGEHDVPDKGCQCGFHALTDRPPAGYHGDHELVVALFGRLLVQDYGGDQYLIRAENQVVLEASPRFVSQGMRRARSRSRVRPQPPEPKVEPLERVSLAELRRRHPEGAEWTVISLAEEARHVREAIATGLFGPAIRPDAGNPPGRDGLRGVAARPKGPRPSLPGAIALDLPRVDEWPRVVTGPTIESRRTRPGLAGAALKGRTERSAVDLA